MYHSVQARSSRGYDINKVLFLVQVSDAILYVFLGCSNNSTVCSYRLVKAAIPFTEFSSILYIYEKLNTSRVDERERERDAGR